MNTTDGRFKASNATEITHFCFSLKESAVHAGVQEEQKITPWDVHGAVVDGKTVAIDYDKLIDQFGCQSLTTDLIARFEKLIGKKAHHWLRRGVLFSHRDFSKILDLYEQGKPFYLYTGRGPSSDSMHLGHMIPFIICKYFQEVFDCYLVIQMSDDEKFLVKDLTIDNVRKYTLENSRDIIAMGFNEEKTFIFSDLDYFGQMYETILRIQKCLNFNQASKVFGFGEADSIGKIAYPATQIAPCFPSTFRHIFGQTAKDIPCFVPCGIDQDPYFRLARDIAARLGFSKPASIYSIFFPALQGFDSKMSASAENTAIFITDSAAQIKAKITKHAFSGGADSLEEHRKMGGNPDIDISFQYLKFFLEDDEELASIEAAYRKGTMLSSELKTRCIDVLQRYVADFQAKRAAVSEETVKKLTAMPTQQPQK